MIIAFFDARPGVQLAKWASNKLVPALGKKKPFPITEPIKDEVKIKEHSMSKVLKLLNLLL